MAHSQAAYGNLGHSSMLDMPVYDAVTTAQLLEEGGIGDVAYTWLVSGLTIPNQRLPVFNLLVFPLTFALVQSLRTRCSLSDSFIQYSSSDFLSFSECSEEFLSGNDFNFNSINSALQSPEQWMFPSVSPDPFTQLPPYTSNLVDPQQPHIPSPSALSVDASPPANTDYHSRRQPVTAGAFRTDSRNRRRHSKRAKTNPSHSQASLLKQFDHVMRNVHSLPSGEKPKNILFTPFFTRDEGHYICLLCPPQTAKVLVNRTQIIQHIVGRHGDTRLFACELWSVIHLTGLLFSDPQSALIEPFVKQTFKSIRPKSMSVPNRIAPNGAYCCFLSFSIL